MRCKGHELIGAYHDEELSGGDRIWVADHIRGCAGCRVLMSDIKRTSKAIAELGRKPAPPALASHIRSSIAAEEREHPVKRVTRWRLPLGIWHQAAALAACCVLSVALTWWIMTSTGEVHQLQQEIVAAHIRSLLQDSPIQIASSDSHTVKPWFAGKVDFAPEVKDLTTEGFPLLGGRLDYVHQRRVGVVIYRRGMHIVNVFMWRTPATDDAVPPVAIKNGHNLLAWTKSGVTYWAVSDLDAEDLKRLQRLL
jgi:anti-sigma factor RsiW